MKHFVTRIISILLIVSFTACSKKAISLAEYNEAVAQIKRRNFSHAVFKVKEEWRIEGNIPSVFDGRGSSFKYDFEIDCPNQTYERDGELRVLHGEARGNYGLGFFNLSDSVGGPWWDAISVTGSIGKRFSSFFDGYNEDKETFIVTESGEYKLELFKNPLKIIYSTKIWDYSNLVDGSMESISKTTQTFNKYGYLTRMISDSSASFDCQWHDFDWETQEPIIKYFKGHSNYKLDLRIDYSF